MYIHNIKMELRVDLGRYSELFQMLSISESKSVSIRR